MAAEDLDLTKYGGDFTTLVSFGGIPQGDISIYQDPSGSSERGKGFEINGTQFATRSGDAARDVIYGRAKVGGTVTFYTTDQGTSGQFLHVFITIAGHEIDAVEKLYLDDREVEFGGGGFFADPRWGLVNTIWQDKVFMSVSTGEDNQDANADLVGQSAALFPGLWTVADRQRGCAGVYLILVYDESLYPNSIPTIQFLVRGKKLYDPREESHVPNHPETYTWSNNAVLAIVDYVANERYGCKAGYAVFPETETIEAADIADEDVGLNGGGTEKRFTVNGTFDTSRSRQSVLDALRSAIATGPMPNIAGKIHIMPRYWRPPTITLTEDDLRSGLRVTKTRSRRDNFNGVKGTFIDAANNHRVSDFPAQTSSLYVAQDSGIEKFLDVVYEFCTSNATAQRNAKIELEVARQPLTVDAFWSLKALQLIPGDTVTLNLPRIFGAEKIFEVISMRLGVDQGGAQGVTMTCQETAEAVTDWNDGQETLIDLAPDTFLPNPGIVQPLTGLTADSGTAQLLRNGDGTIITRVLLEWDTPTDPFGDEIEIEFKKSADSVWERNPNVDFTATHAHVVNAQDGVAYDFRARIRTGAGFKSAYTTVLGHVVVGKTAPPSDVINFHADLRPFGIVLGWDKVTDVDLRGYELRMGGALDDWDSASFLEEVRGTSYRVETQTAGTYKFFIRAIDTSGNYSFLPSGDTVVVPAPNMPEVESSISGPNLLLDWEDVVSFFQLDHYEVSFGATYGASTLLLNTKSTQYSANVDFGGTRRFYVVSVDVHGNKSTPAVIDVSILSPGPVQSISSEPIDNYATFSWAPPSTGTLPIASYDIYRGDDFGSASFLGSVDATLFTRFEAASGTFTYWIVAEDTAGNEGTPASLNVIIDQPPDFVLLSSGTLPLEDATTLTNALLDTDNTIVLPVDTLETWDDRDDTYPAPQDQIDAGYPYYLQPTPSTAQVILEHDLGALFNGAMVSFLYQIETIVAGLTITPTLSTSDDGMAWTDYAGTLTAFEAGDFQYIRLTLDATGGGHALVRLLSASFSVSVKLKRDSGSGEALTTDADGTQVNFNASFLDVLGTPQLTPTEIIRASESHGSSNYLIGGDQADFEPGTGDFTICGWVRLEHWKNGPTFAHKWDGVDNNQREWILTCDQTTGVLYWIITQTGSSNILVASPDPLPVGVWCFLQAWHDSTGDVIGCRINKNVSGTLSHSTGIYAGTRTNPMQLQGRGNSAGATVQGQMRNWAIWKGRFLSESELNAIYDLGFCRYSDLSSGQKTSMVGYWPLGETSGTREDAHSSNHDLTVNGTVTSRILPTQVIADFQDVPNPTGFKALAFTESQVRVTSRFSWYADGYTTVGA